MTGMAIINYVFPASWEWIKTREFFRKKCAFPAISRRKKQEKASEIHLFPPVFHPFSPLPLKEMTGIHLVALRTRTPQWIICHLLPLECFLGDRSAESIDLQKIQ